jgi:hypothetical protein
MERADLIDPKQTEDLASKARLILDEEISKRVTTLASTRASVLLGWRECGSPMGGPRRLQRGSSEVLVLLPS